LNFEETYKRHNRMVFNLALNYVQNVEDAEEITQIPAYKQSSFLQLANIKKTFSNSWYGLNPI
jgi:hypothetical protein